MITADRRLVGVGGASSLARFAELVILLSEFPHVLAARPGRGS